MHIYKDKEKPFIELFNPKNGLLVRTNLLDENGKETNELPQSRYLPELIDIGIMGHCSNGITCANFGIVCYQGKEQRNNLPFSKYKKILKQIRGYTFQVALGGKGDPNKHEKFKKILKYTRKMGIIPNLTTSGLGITDSEITSIKKYCGAVAVSFYSRLNEKGEESNSECIGLINKFKNDIITNIHYVINQFTVKDAIERLRHDNFPNGINGVIFLLYKPAENMNSGRYDVSDKELKEFFDVIFKNRHPFKIGFDTCFTPLLIAYNSKLRENASVQHCESGRFSCYISSDFKLFDCSFRQHENDGIDLSRKSFLNAWRELVKHRKSRLCPFQVKCK